jgi:hypothetical protein
MTRIRKGSTLNAFESVSNKPVVCLPIRVAVAIRQTNNPTTVAKEKNISRPRRKCRAKICPSPGTISDKRAAMGAGTRLSFLSTGGLYTAFLRSLMVTSYLSGFFIYIRRSDSLFSVTSLNSSSDIFLISCWVPL